ncbi:hypothetical protein GGX14DRAFT_410485, partial [Mycena pura]
MSTSMLSKISTLLTTTLISIQSFLLWLFTFEPSPALPVHASSVTPYPLSLDSEGRVIDISYHSTCVEDGAGVKRIDPVGLPVAPDSVANPPVASKIPIEYEKHRSRSVQPLSIVTNFARVPSPGLPRKHKQTDVPSQCLGDAENKRNPARVAPLKPRTPLRKMSRYLNLTGTSPSKAVATAKTSTCVANASPSLTNSYPVPRRRSVVGRVPCAGTPRTDDDKPTPLELESGLACADARDDAVVDFAARVRSVFYKCRVVEQDLDDDCESEIARDVFSRDSVWNSGWPIFPFGTASDAASVDENARCDKGAFVDFMDADGPVPRSLSVSSGLTCFAPSEARAPSKASSDSSTPFQCSSSPELRSVSFTTSDSDSGQVPSDVFATVYSSSRTRPLRCSSSSELPYVCDRDRDTDTNTNMFSSCTASFSSPSWRTVSSSSSGGAFNDLLASLERKFPVKEWSELVGFEFPPNADCGG